jgi:hypothetical protein
MRISRTGEAQQTIALGAGGSVFSWLLFSWLFLSRGFRSGLAAFLSFLDDNFAFAAGAAAAVATTITTAVATTAAAIAATVTAAATMVLVLVTATVVATTVTAALARALATAVAGALTAALAHWLLFAATLRFFAASLLAAVVVVLAMVPTAAEAAAAVMTATKAAAVTAEAAMTATAAATMTATGFSLGFHTDHDNGQSGQRDHRAEHISIHRNSSNNKHLERLPDNCVVFHESTKATRRRCTAVRTGRAEARVS